MLLPIRWKSAAGASPGLSLGGLFLYPLRLLLRPSSTAPRSFLVWTFSRRKPYRDTHLLSSSFLNSARIAGENRYSRWKRVLE